MVLGEEAAVDGVILVGADADDGKLRHAVLEFEQAGQLFDAGGAPGGPEIEHDDPASKAGEIEGLDAICDGEGRRDPAETIGVISAIAAAGQQRSEADKQKKEEPGSTHDASASYNTEL